MNWNHVVVEGYCLYEDKVFENVACCKTKPGFTSILCLNAEDKNEKCSYFGCVRARSCVVLTDELGNDVACKTFECNEIDSAKYEEKEREWIECWEKDIENR